ncbi:hypothetical protein KAR91_37565 [Candidatus Pacearchaeota archaeon]|nr:hypothetical protein [Candidatus Pacearchaeota archaeon]
MYTVAYEEDEDIFYLNHSCMSTLSFGSEDMAWTTEDREKAELMADKIGMRHGNPVEVVEI